MTSVHSMSLRERLSHATGDRYRIDEELGRGGMAVVFAATDVRLKREVAIKVLPPELAFRGDVRSRFLREAQMAAGLSHPHVVAIYAVEETDGLVYMVMGRVQGESLAQRLLSSGRLPSADVRRILRETAEALAHAHSRGVIHRDIKPDNILLEHGSGHVVVTDFGIARAMEGDARLTVTGVTVGTPTYMSPEQARGEEGIDGRADVYALGVVGYQMLAGEAPFAAANTPALLLKHVTEPPPPLAVKRPDAPRALIYAIERALAKDRDVRWSGAAAMRDALADDAVAPPPPQHAGEWSFVVGNTRAGVVGGPPDNAHGVELPKYPAWRGGGREERERWRAAQRAWRERIREHQRAMQEEIRARHDDARHARGERRGRSRSLADRIASFQRHVVSNVLVMFVLFMINAATGGFPWFIFPVLGMTIGIVAHGLSLWQAGVRLRDVLRSPAHLREAHASVRIASDDNVDERALALVGSRVLGSSHGGTVRRAIEDEAAIRDVIATLPAADRAQLPDVNETLRALMERVVSLAQALERLDADVRPEQLAAVEERLAHTRANGADASDRRVTLLERQRASLVELGERRATLATQLESASLVLHTMRLDLLRLRSAGIANAAADVQSVTQEARALSDDIGRVLDAAEETRRL